MAYAHSLLIATLALAAALPSQVDDARGETAEQASGAMVRRTAWSATDSRQLFTSVDRSRDDRLDIFEAGAGLGAVADHKARKDFERIDTNRDGYIDFGEFDDLFRRVVEYRESFLVRPYYALPEVQSNTESASPAMQVIQKFDRDGDLALGRDELLKLLEKFGVANLIGTMADLDLDRSSTLDAKEFAPVVDRMPQLQSLVTTRSTSEVPADHDGNGVVDSSELARGLELLDPGLGRWAPRILERADRNGDQQLGPDELGIIATAQAR